MVYAAQIHVDLNFQFFEFLPNRTDDLCIYSPVLWPTELVLHRLGCKRLHLESSKQKCCIVCFMSNNDPREKWRKCISVTGSLRGQAQVRPVDKLDEACTNADDRMMLVQHRNGDRVMS